MTLPDMMSRVEPLKVHGKLTRVGFLPRYSLYDQTLIIAAFMVMRHPKFDGALYGVVGAGCPDVLSTGLGRIVPNLISRKHTNSTTTDNCLSPVHDLSIFSLNSNKPLNYNRKVA